MLGQLLHFVLRRDGLALLVLIFRHGAAYIIVIFSSSYREAYSRVILRLHFFFLPSSLLFSLLRLD